MGSVFDFVTWVLSVFSSFVNMLFDWDLFSGISVGAFIVCILVILVLLRFLVLDSGHGD